ncbi:MAG: hypothetical protein IID54_08010 [Proteobacteria bacterium]|nr:hypothetical protein [Pseudomonadota bacterium]
MLDSVKRWLIQLTEMGLLLVALFVVLQILFGPDTGFLISNVVANLLALIKSLGDSGLVGLIAIGVILYLFGKRA